MQGRCLTQVRPMIPMNDGMFSIEMFTMGGVGYESSEIIYPCLRNSSGNTLLRAMTSGWGAPQKKHLHGFSQWKKKRFSGILISRHTTDGVLPRMRLVGTIISRSSFRLFPDPSFFDTFDFFFPWPGPGLLSWSSSRSVLRPRLEDDGRVDVSDRPMARIWIETRSLNQDTVLAWIKNHK